MLRSSYAFSCVSVAIALAGCSTNRETVSPSSLNGEACSFGGAIPTPPKASTLEYGDGVPSGMSTETYAEAEGLAYLDSFVGQYLRNEVTLYQGTLQASDNQSVLGDDCAGRACKNESIASGPAVASLTVADGGATLTASSLDAHKHIIFTQTKAEANVTDVGLVLADTSAGGNSAPCKGCVPSFLSKPSSIDFTKLVATADVAVSPTSGDAGADAGAGAALSIQATGSLTRATPCELTFSDLVELNSQNGLVSSNEDDASSGGTTFAQQGNEMVATIQSSLYTYSADYETSCVTTYTLDLYVSLTNLADYGVRNYRTFIPDQEAGYYYGTPCPN